MIKISNFRLKNKEEEDSKGRSNIGAKAFARKGTWDDLMDSIHGYDRKILLLDDEEESSPNQLHQDEEDFFDSIAEIDLQQYGLDLSFSTRAPSQSVSPTHSPTVNEDGPTQSPTISQPSEDTVSPTESVTSPSVFPSSTPTTSAPTISQHPTRSPRPSQSPTTSLNPTTSNAPSRVTTSPTRFPSTAPITETPSKNPFSTMVPTADSSSITLQPTRSPSLSSSADLVFTCTDEGVDLASPPHDDVTIVQIKVGYLVESLLASTEYMADVHDQILEASVVNALQCGSGGPLFGPNGVIPSIPMVTTLSGQDCEPEISLCTTMETDFSFAVDEIMNSDTAAFLAYVSLQDGMDGGRFALDIDGIDRMEYLSPLPLIPPFPPNGQLTATSNDDLGVSPYTMGAVGLVSVGGFLALGAWARNRRNRNTQHMHLLENMSLESL